MAWRMCVGFAEALDRLIVRRDVMADNLAGVGSAVCAENLMMTLAPLVGRLNLEIISVGITVAESWRQK